MMLNRRQSQLAPLTEENLKKHRTETSPRQTSSKRFIERQTSWRSVGDGQSVELQYDEHILESSAGDQKKDDDQGIDYFDLILPNNTSANVTLGEMNVKSDKNYSLKTSRERNDGLKMNDNTREDQSIEQQKGNEPSTEETLKFDFDFNGEIAGQLEKKEKEGSDDAENSDEDSDFSSPLDTDSDVTYDNNKKLQNVNSSAASADSSCSSSPLVDETDDEDDDDDDDDETEEDDGRENSWAKSEDELSHYTSSLNASVSSIPTLYDDRESPETPSSPDESPNYNENQAENGELRNGHDEEIYDKEKYIENRLNEEVILKENDQNKMETLSNCSDGNLSPLQSRQVCGRSASPLTVVMSEFDDVESTIFDHREASSLDSSSRNKFTSLDSNESSEVSIKNWVRLKEDSVTNRADSEQCGSPVHKDIKIKGKKRKIKTRKELNAKKTYLIKIVKKNIPTTKVLKYHNLSKTNPKKSDQVDFQKEMVKGQISMSDDSDGVNEEQNINRMARRKLKRPSKKRVSFEDSKTAENISKMTLNDSGVFGRCTESRDNEEEASPRSPESENSGRGSSHWSAVESDLSAGSGTKPASTVYSPRSLFSSRQTTLVDKMTTRNALLESVSLEQRRINLAAVRKRGPSKPKIKKSHSAASKLTSKTTGSDQSSMMRRVLSANRNKVSRLHNIVEELQQEIDELKSENKSLKRVSHRQEKEIKKIDEEESSVPILLQRHSAEMRTLKERLRRNQDVLHKKERESQDRDKEIQKLQDKIKNYRELSQNKKLEERASLAKKLQNVENEIALKDKKILDLEKTLTLKDKMRQRDMKEQKDRYRQAKEELKRVQEDFRSLRERLQEKERELDEKNIYHQHIIQKKKKAVAFPALTAAISHDPALTTPVLRAEKLPDRKEKHPNVFLTNALSDSGSVITEEGKESVHTTVVSDTRSEKLAAADAITPSVFDADRRDKNEEARLRNEAEERRKLEEEERKRRAEEEDMKRKEEEEKRREKEEDERRKNEEEELRKLREEQERERKRKEDEDKQRLEEEAETRRKKDLLLARMRAIDAGNEKTNDEITTETTAVDSLAVENKPKKLPIFLQSETLTKKESQQAKPTVTPLSEDDIFSDAGSDKKRSSARSKQSGYSYDFKQTVENLHHGLPAHASLENVKEAAADSTSDDLSFGGYKPTLGRRAAAKRADSKNKDELSFGGYNPSFGAKKDVTRKSSGLDFGSGNKFTTQKDQNGSISGEYKPTFGAASSKASATLPTSDIFGEGSGIARGRRPREFPGKGNTVFGDELLTNEVKATVSPALFGDKSFTANNKSSYPWENKVDVARRTSSNKEQDDSLLPRRRNLQSIGKSAEKNIPVVDNALDDIDDEIEEVIL